MSALPPTTEVGRRIVVSVWLSVYELVCLQLDEFAAEFLRLLPLLSAQASIAQAGHATALSSPGIVGSTRYPSSPVCGLLSDTSGAFHLYLSRLLPTHQGAAFSMLTTVRGLRVGPSCSVTLPLMPRASRARARSCSGSRLSVTMISPSNTTS